MCDHREPRRFWVHQNTTLLRQGCQALRWMLAKEKKWVSVIIIDDSYTRISRTIRIGTRSTNGTTVRMSCAFQPLPDRSLAYAQFVRYRHIG